VGHQCLRSRVPSGFAFGGNDQFQGHKDDPESGLHYNLARYYDPKISRWAAADSVTARVFDPQSLNKYAYVRKNPVNLVDPDGKDPVYVSPEPISGGTVLAPGYGEPKDWYYIYYMVGWGYFMNDYILSSNGTFYQPTYYPQSGSGGGGGGDPSQYYRQNLVDTVLSTGLNERALDPNCAKFLNGVIANLARVPAGFDIDKLIKNIQSAQINPSGLGENQVANTRDGNTINLGGQAYTMEDNGSDLLSRLFHEGFHLVSSGGIGGVGLTASFGPGGEVAARIMSYLKTNLISRYLTEREDWQEDDIANRLGQLGGDCDARCRSQIPRSSPGNPPFPGW
jgi:RHS repeat-associated protein